MDFFRRKDGEENNGENYEFYEDTHDENGEYTSRLRNFRRDSADRQGAMQSDRLGTDGTRQFSDGEFSSYRPQPARTRTADRMPGVNQNIMVYEPQTSDDVQTLIDFLKTHESAIINLDNIDPDVSQRMLDFVSGAIYALNGSVHRISGNIFLLSPEGVGITKSYENRK